VSTVVVVVGSAAVVVVGIEVAVVLDATVVVTAALALGVDESAGAVVALSSLDEHAASIVNANNTMARRRATMLTVSVSSAVRGTDSDERPCVGPGDLPRRCGERVGDAFRRAPLAADHVRKAEGLCPTIGSTAHHGLETDDPSPDVERPGPSGVRHGVTSVRP
jgi:hypothetical protein